MPMPESVAPAAPATPATTTDAPAAPPAAVAATDAAAPVVPDAAATAKAELNAALKKAGVKLRAKDREYEPRDIDDLVARANRVHGVEAMLAEAKSTRAQAEEVLSLRKAIDEATDVDSALAALERLGGPRARQLAVEMTRRQMAREESEQQMSEGEKTARKQLEEHQRVLRDYQQRDERARAEEEERTYRTESARLRDEAGKTATDALRAMGIAPEAAQRIAPGLLPLVARHMRVAMESGEPLDATALSEMVREEWLGGYQAATAQMDDASLYGFLGDDSAKRVVREHLRRHKAAPRNGEAPTAKTTEGKTERPGFGTPGYFR